MTSIEIENTWINIAYLPVNTEPVDKINLCYEGISDIIMKGYDENKKVIIIGDLNSHIRGWYWENNSDAGGLKIDELRRTFGVKIHNVKEQWTCQRKTGIMNERSIYSYSLIDWTLSTADVRITDHTTL